MTQTLDALVAELSAQRQCVETYQRLLIAFILTGETKLADRDAFTITDETIAEADKHELHCDTFDGGAVYYLERKPE